VRNGTGSDPSTVDRTCGSRPCQPSPKAENAKERAPRVGGDALSNPPGCGKWVGHVYNAPTSWLFQGRNEKEARPLSATPPPAQAAARRAADITKYADSRRTDLFPQITRGDCRSATGGGSRVTVNRAAAPSRKADNSPAGPPRGKGPKKARQRAADGPTRRALVTTR
jgi:hypothetical protein